MEKADSNNGGKAKGAIISIAAHVVILLLLVSFTLVSGIEVELPDLPVKEFIAVELVQPPKIPVRRGTENVTPAQLTEKPREQAPQTAKVSDIVRAPKPGNKPDTKPVTAGDDGDVAVYETPQPKVNEKALFRSTTDGEADGHEVNKIKDNSTYNGAGKNDEPTRTASTPSGFTTSDKGVSFSLSGRSVSGGFPKPVYNLQKSGKVVVEITVDQNGVVTNAHATAKGSTLQDATLWKAAEDAARRARFNVDKNAAPLQSGTITYIFTLN